jgi:8-oxo-dGTP pyrophosphatase MutT (NUDIX family)
MRVHRSRRRQAARVLLVGPGPCVLLVGGRDPTVAGAHEFWVVPGGGTAPGESPEAAARRELWEETGLALNSLGPVAWERHVEFSFAGNHYSQYEYFFVVRHELFEPIPGHLTTDEVAWVTGARWWLLSELESNPVVVHPPGLPNLVRQWFAYGTPPRPLRIDAVPTEVEPATEVD